jgi:hypothetical protein
MPSPCTNRSSTNAQNPGQIASPRLAMTVMASAIRIVRTRPIVSAAHPEATAPTSMPTEPAVTARVSCHGASAHSCRITGSV